jgi:hypothetical protein
MKKLRLWALLLATSLVAGCNYVTTEEFNTYKQGVKASGDAVEEWIKSADTYIRFLNANIGTFCPNCDPPTLPPPPPPDGQWGS